MMGHKDRDGVMLAREDEKSDTRFDNSNVLYNTYRRTALVDPSIKFRGKEIIFHDKLGEDEDVEGSAIFEKVDEVIMDEIFGYIQNRSEEKVLPDTTEDIESLIGADADPAEFGEEVLRNG
jgi:hypothetical protein